MAPRQTLRAPIEELGSRGDRPAILALQKNGVRSWSYSELDDRVRRLAAGLVDAGVGRKVTVGLWADERPELIVAALAVIAAGGVAVPLDAQFSGKVLKGVLEDSDVEYLFTTKNRVEPLQELGIEREIKPILLDADEKDSRSWLRWCGEPLKELPEVQPDDETTLFYTSGTTGAPKGVPLTHGNLAFQVNAVAEANVVTEDDRVLLPLPLHHVYPFVVGTLTPLALGLTIVMPHALTGPQIVRALKEGDVSVVIGVPRLYGAMVQGIEAKVKSQGRLARGFFKCSAGLSTQLRRRLGMLAGKRLLKPLHNQFGGRLRVLASGGSPLDPELAMRLEGFGWLVAIGYGLTETSPLLTINPPGKARLASVGRPVPGVEIRIDTSTRPETQDDEEQQDQSADQATESENAQGEIQAKGPNVFRGYRNLPDKSEEAFTEDGWFRTGDLGEFDDDGYLYVRGRIKEMLVTPGGENVQPENVEAVYAEHPFIREAGILQREEQLVAAIVPDINALRRGREDGEGDIDQAIHEAVSEQSKKLPSYQRIADFVVTTDPLPRTRLSKLQRHKLADRYERAQRGEEESLDEKKGPMPLEKMAAEDRTLLDDPAAQQLWEHLAERYPDRYLTPDTSPQLDLGIDSLEWLNLTMEIGQRSGVELDEDAIGRIETIRDLLREISEAATGEAAGERVDPLEQPEEALSDEQLQRLEPGGALTRAIAWSGFGLNRRLMRMLFRVQVEGVENLPKDSPYVIAANHLSALDPATIATALDQQQLRRTYWTGWTGAVFQNRLARFVSRATKTLPIDPQSRMFSSLAYGAAVLKRGNNLIWFPEGTRSPDGRLQEFRPGLGLLLHRYRVPVVPTLLQGTHDALPPGNWLPRPKRVRLVFGKPLDPEQLEREGEGAEPHERLMHALHEHIKSLSE